MKPTNQLSESVQRKEYKRSLNISLIGIICSGLLSFFVAYSTLTINRKQQVYDQKVQAIKDYLNASSKAVKLFEHVISIRCQQSKLLRNTAIDTSKSIEQYLKNTLYKTKDASPYDYEKFIEYLDKQHETQVQSYIISVMFQDSDSLFTYLQMFNNSFSETNMANNMKATMTGDDINTINELETQYNIRESQMELLKNIRIHFSKQLKQ